MSEPLETAVPAAVAAAGEAPAKQRGFVGNVMLLAGGTAVAQLLVIGASPILSRLYTPAEFGTFSVFSALLLMLMGFASLRYEFAIPLARDDREGFAVLTLAHLLLAVSAVTTVLLVLALRGPVVRWTHTPALAPYLWLLPLAVLAGGSYQALSFWASRRKEFGRLSVTKATQGGGQVAIQVGMGVAGFGASGLILGFVAGQTLGVGSLLRSAWAQRIPAARGALRAVARQYRDFPRYHTWNSLVDIVGLQFPTLLFAAFFSVADAGSFAMAMRVLGLPAALLGQAVAQVFYPAAAERGQAQSRELVERVATASFVAALSVFSLVWLFGPFAFGFAFGPEWNTSGRFAQYLAPWLVVSFVVSPLSSYVLVHGKLRQAMVVSVLNTTLRVATIWAGSRAGSADLAVQLFSLAGLVLSVGYLGWILKLAGSGLGRWVMASRRTAIVGALLVAALFALKTVTPPALGLAVAIVSTAAFAAWFWMTDGKRMQHA